MKTKICFASLDFGKSLYGEIFLNNWPNLLYYHRPGSTTEEVKKFKKTSSDAQEYFKRFGLIHEDVKGDLLSINYLGATTTKKPYLLVTRNSTSINLYADYYVILVRHPCACWLVTQHSRWTPIEEYTKFFLDYHKGIKQFRDKIDPDKYKIIKFEDLLDHNKRKSIVTGIANWMGLPTEDMHDKFYFSTPAVSEYFSDMDVGHFYRWNAFETKNQNHLDYMYKNMKDYFKEWGYSGTIGWKIRDYINEELEERSKKEQVDFWVGVSGLEKQKELKDIKKSKIDI